MEIRLEDVQRHCRTCLVELVCDAFGRNMDAAILDAGRLLRQHQLEVMAVLDMESSEQLPHHMCHNCYETVQVANDMRAKVQQAEQQLLQEQEVINVDDGLISCRLCLRRYPVTVQSLTCRVRDSPHLKEWLEWSIGHGIGDEWFSHAVCRFCYGKLRDCYEWHIAAADSAEYLKQTLTNDQSWMQEISDEDSLNKSFCNQSKTQTSPFGNADHHGEYSRHSQTSEYENATSIQDFSEDFGDSLANSLLCRLDVPSENGAAAFNLISSTQKKSSTREPQKKVCHQCHQRFNKAILLEAHILHVHQGKERPFLCKYCTHAYITHTHLKRHLRTAHKKEERSKVDSDHEFLLDL